jgi:hypothetical protein
MKKLLVLLVLAAVAGWLVYQYVLRTPEARLCDRLAELCGDAASSSCEHDFTKLRQTLGPASVERAADCMSESDSCPEALGCMGTGLLQEAARELTEGLERGLKRD